MSPRIIQIPLSGGDRKAQAKGIRRAHGLSGSYFEQSQRIRSTTEPKIREADRLECEAWNAVMWAGGPARPAPGEVKAEPTIGKAINGDCDRGEMQSLWPHPVVPLLALSMLVLDGVADVERRPDTLRSPLSLAAKRGDLAQDGQSRHSTSRRLPTRPLMPFSFTKEEAAEADTEEEADTQASPRPHHAWRSQRQRQQASRHWHLRYSKRQK
jgi:hypothetical protein